MNNTIPNIQSPKEFNNFFNNLSRLFIRKENEVINDVLKIYLKRKPNKHDFKKVEFTKNIDADNFTLKYRGLILGFISRKIENMNCKVLFTPQLNND